MIFSRTLRSDARPPTALRRRPARRRVAHLAVLPLVSALVAAGSPASAQDDDGARSAPPAAPGPPTTVTLVTGDRVTLHAAGGAPGVTVDPAPRPGGHLPRFYVTGSGDDLYVTPSDLVSLVPHRIDPELFNVTALVDAGLDDASSDSIPVIVTYPDGAAPRTAAALPGLRDSRPLPSVGATAGSLGKPDAGDAPAALAGAAGHAAGSPDSPRSVDPLADVEKIWWDRPVEVLLDDSTDQISVDAARAAGLDGSGITVAVLDTGVDESHPDLAGRVVDAADFTATGPPLPVLDPPAVAADAHGHGTHVAGTVAGDGAASDGQYEGVAPGVSLLSGKVVDDFGVGLTSWIIDGMEWAAGSGADIVNLSLGSSQADPLMIEAVERLTATSDTLFVVAAGNDGCDMCIGSPGDAPSALTVGAVDAADELAAFSSRGPTAETRLLKPELTAPGVGIMAPRSSAVPGDTPYQELSGTSMAAPHVTGAAALLAQAYPDLGAAGLKGALMSTAVPTDGLTGYEQGAGRVDVGRLVAAPVLATTPALDLGVVPHPRSEDDPARRTVSYRNTTDQQVTLDLSAEVTGEGGDAVGANVVTIEPSELTVPAGGTAEADVTINVAAVGPGQYAGLVVAGGPDGLVLRTPLSFFNEEEHAVVTFEAVMRDGREIAGNYGLDLVDVDTGVKHWWEPCPQDDGRVLRCARIPVGTYAVMGVVPTAPAWHDGLPDYLFAPPLHTALVGDPELTVDRDMTVTLDARDAVEVTVETPAHDTRANLGGAMAIMWHRQPVDGPIHQSAVVNSPGDQLEERLFVQPTEAVTRGRFSAATRWQLATPSIAMSVVGHDGPALDPYYYRSDVFRTNPRLDGAHTLPLADSGEADPAELDGADLDGALALVRRSDDVPVAEQVARVAAAGAELVAVYHDEPGVNTDPGQFGLPLEVPTVRLSHEEGMALRDLLADGPVTVRAEGEPASPFLYDLVYTEEQAVPDQLHYTADPDTLARVDRDFRTQLGDSPQYFEVAFPWQPWDQYSHSVWREIGEFPHTRADYRTTAQRWRYAMSLPADPLEPQQLAFDTPLFDYTPGERVRQSMMRQPLVPALPGQQPVARLGDTLAISLPGIRDGEGNFSFPADMPAFHSVVRLWHGGDLLLEKVREGNRGPFLPPPVELPPDERTYRLEYRFDNGQPWARLSTRARTEWTFRSGHVDPGSGEVEVPPLLRVVYDIPLDLTNRSLPPEDRRDAPVIGVRVGHATGVDGPAIAGARLWVSSDEGETWQERPLRRASGDGGYEFVAPDPDAGGFVSLRLEAWDSDGNRIAQEIIRAYATINR